MGSTEEKCDGIKEENYYGNTKSFSVGTSDDAKLGYCYIKMIGVTDYSKLGEVISYKKAASIGVS